MPGLVSMTQLLLSKLNVTPYNTKIKFAKSRVNTRVNTIWESLKTSLLTARELHVPSRITSVRFSKPWITRESRCLIRIKKRRFKKFKQTKRPPDWEKYQQAARNSRKACADAFNHFIHHSTGGTTRKNCLALLSQKGRSLKIMVYTTYNKDVENERILNKQFTSVFSSQ